MDTPNPADVRAVTVRRSEQIAKLAVSLCAAQAEVENPTKNKQNPHLKNWYADLTVVLAAVVPVFNRHQLAVTQLPCEADGEPAMMTLLLHSSGEWLETVMKIRPVKNDPQAIGSAQSYARRYSLMSLAGVAGEDDDGHEASQPAPRPAPAASRATAPPKAEAEPDPVGSSQAMSSLLIRKGKTWGEAIVWLSRKTGVKYAEGFEWEQLPEAQRRMLVEAVTAMPDQKR